MTTKYVCVFFFALLFSIPWVPWFGRAFWLTKRECHLSKLLLSAVADKKSKHNRHRQHHHQKEIGNLSDKRVSKSAEFNGKMESENLRFKENPKGPRRKQTNELSARARAAFIWLVDRSVGVALCMLYCRSTRITRKQYTTRTRCDINQSKVCLLMKWKMTAPNEKFEQTKTAYTHTQNRGKRKRENE